MSTTTPWWRQIANVGCLGCVLPFGAYLAFNFFFFGASKPIRDAENQTRGETVAGAVEQYRVANGRYPEKLEDLSVPIPRTRGSSGDDRAFDYAVIASGAGFTLSFSEAPMMSMDDSVTSFKWSSQTKKWEHQ